MQSACVVIYWYLWSPGSTIFSPHYLIHDIIFEKKKFFLNLKSVFIFSTTLSVTYVFPKFEQDITKNVQWSTCKEPVIPVRF